MFILITTIAHKRKEVQRIKKLGQFRSDVISMLRNEGFNREEIDELFDGYPVEMSSRKTYSLLRLKPASNH